MLRKRDSNLIWWDINLLIMIPAYVENVQCHLATTLIPFNASVVTGGTVSSSVT